MDIAVKRDALLFNGLRGFVVDLGSRLLLSLLFVFYCKCKILTGFALKIESCKLLRDDARRRLSSIRHCSEFSKHHINEAEELIT